MRLTHFTIEIAVVDPDDPTHRAEYKLERYDREALLRMEPIGTLIRTWEEEEESDGEPEGKGTSPKRRRRK